MKRLLTVAAAVLFTAFAAPVNAQTCAPSEIAFDALKNNWGEALIESKPGENGAEWQLWANEETGSWTLLLILTDGSACQISAGNNYKHPAAV